MFRIAGVDYTLSEAAYLIKADPNSVWHKQYMYYLPKIERSGAANFANLAALLTQLANYRTKESGMDNQKLARMRGTPLATNVALNLTPIARANVLTADQVAIAHLMAGNASGNGVSDESQHDTDPETGSHKSQKVSVKEYYINGADGRRATKRVEGHKITYYYSDSHAYSSYKYQLLR